MRPHETRPSRIGRLVPSAMTRDQVGRTVSALAALAVTIMFSAGCTGTNNSGPGNGPGVQRGPSQVPTLTATTPSTAWHQVTDEIGADGVVSKDTALRAFSLAFGPLPGVSVPPDASAPVSGTGALRWLVGHWSALTSAQRGAAISLVPALAELPATGSKFVGRRFGATIPADVLARPAAPTPGPNAALYTAVANKEAREITSRLGIDLTLTIEADERRTAAISDAETTVTTADGKFVGTPAICRISFNPLKSLIGEYFAMVMAHEVWHCFEGQIMGLERFNSAAGPSWLIEGQAEWVGYALHPDARSDGFYDLYIQHPERPLFTRSYAAIGYYSQLAHTGIDTWRVLAPMLRETTNAAAFQAAGSASDKFLYQWASSFFRAATLGDAWTMSGPGLAPGPGSKDGAMTVAKGGSTTFGTAAYTNAIFQLASKADIVSFSVSGHVRLGDVLTKRDYLVKDGSAFCTSPDGCTCPAGSTYEGPPLTKVDTTTMFAVSGGTGGTKGTVTGRTIDEFCGKPKARAGALKITGCPPTGWMSELMRKPYRFDGNGISPGFKTPPGQTWCVWVPVAEDPGGIRLLHYQLARGKDLPPQRGATELKIPGLDHAWLKLFPNHGVGAAQIFCQAGGTVLHLEVMAKGKPRVDLVRRLLDRIITTYQT